MHKPHIIRTPKLILFFLCLYSLHTSLILPAAQSSSIAPKRNIHGTITDVKKIGDDLWVGVIDASCYLAMERLRTAEDCKKWADYASDQIRSFLGQKTTDYLYPSRNKKYQIDECRSAAFLQQIVPEKLAKYDVWVAYISNRPVSAKAVVDHYKNSDIQMFVSVTTSPAATIISPMGIRRSFASFSSSWGVKKNLTRPKSAPRRPSLLLQAFCGMAAHLHYSNKYFIFTNPITAMNEIFAENLPSNTVFFKEPNIVPSGKHVTLRNADGSKTTTFNRDAPEYSWLSTLGFIPRNSNYVLIDIAKLSDFITAAPEAVSKPFIKTKTLGIVLLLAAATTYFIWGLGNPKKALTV